MKRFPVHEESSGKSSFDKSMRSVSCGYELILCDYIMKCYVHGGTNSGVCILHI